jgi:hypothetical protein
MATRFRLTSDSTAPDVSPAVQSYTHTASTRRKLKTSDASALTSQAVTPDAADHTTPGDSLHVQFVSDAMAAGVTFTSGDAIKLCVQCFQASLTDTLAVQLYCAVVDNAGTTVRRVIRSKTQDDVNLFSALQSRILSDTQDGSTYTTVTGDRLVVEVSVYGTPVPGPGVNGHNATIRWGGDGSADLAENDSQNGTTLNPWVEFVPTAFPPSGTPATGSATLFIRGFDAATASLPLYVAGPLSATGGLTLFAAGRDSASGHIPLYLGSSADASGSVPLYTPGHAPASGGLPLYTYGWDDRSGQVPLFLAGHLPDSGGHTLFVEGIPNSGQAYATLFTTNFNTASGLFPLYGAGHQTSAHGMYLFAQADQVPAASGLFPLFAYGGTQSGNAAVIDLYTFSDANGQTVRRGMNLVLLGSATDRQTRNMNLWVEGRNRDATGPLTLYAHNTQSGVALGVSLYASGDGVTPDALGSNRSLNLVLARDPANAMPLFVKGPGSPGSGSVSLFTFGAMPAAAGANLAVPKVVGGQTKTAKLYTHGF